MILDDIVKYIDGQSTALTRGTNLFASGFPKGSAATAVAVYETGGLSPQWAIGATSPAVERPRIQVVSRSSSYQTARTRARLVDNLLDHAVANTTLTGSTSTKVYMTIMAVQSPFSIGQDANDCWMISCNYQVEKERT